ncbi:MAG: CocE/NonD family hydrolase [Deltaproteobacteria bacterium]|nr:CocE/NonD family hydrolase [Deltaproteobacteria bacterium]
MKSLKITLNITLLLILLFYSSLYAGPLTDSSKNKLTEQIEKLGISDLKIDFNVRIPIQNPDVLDDKRPANPAGGDEVDLWATTIHHTSINPDTNTIKRPTILVATAYRREFMLPAYLLTFLKNGYNIMSVDMRGTGSTGGPWGAMNPIEQYDIVYVIDRWIPTREWSNGKIGMVGGSYMAIVQYLISGLVEKEFNAVTGKTEPKHLKAIAPLSTLSDVYDDIAMHGGNLEMEFMGVWIAATDFLSILPPDLYLGDSANGLGLDDIKEAADIWKEHVGNLTVPVDWIMDTNNMYQNHWYKEKSPYIYWPQKPDGGWGFGNDYPDSTGRAVIPENLPVFNTTGWFDIFTRGTLNNYQYGLVNHSDSDKALVVGPWYHIDASFACPGLDGIGIGEGLINYDILLRWFDWKIKGKNDPFMEEFPVALYIMGEEKWRMEKSWPLKPSRTESKTYYLSKAKPSSISGDWFSALNYLNNYKLVENVSDSDYYNKFLWFKRSKKNPVLRHDPPFFHGLASRSAQRWFGFSPLSMVSQFSKYTFNKDIDHLMPWEDERADELGALTFTTEPLKNDIEISGPLKLTFWAKTKFNRALSQAVVKKTLEGISKHFKIEDNENSLIEMADKKDVQWVIEVNDVFPNGRARNITSGWMSAWHRPYNPSNPKEVDPAYTPFDPFYENPNVNPSPIEEGTLYPYVIEIWPTDNVFKKGHRIRVSISASDIPHLFPFFRPSVNTIVIDPDHKAKIDFKTVNKEGEGLDWKWVDNVSQYLKNHNN